MKRTVLISVLFFISLLTYAQKADNKEVKIAQVNLSVNMDCSACEANVKKHLAYTRGVTSVVADHETNTVIIKYRTKRTSVDKLIESLKSINYAASVQKSNCNPDRQRAARSCCTQ